VSSPNRRILAVALILALLATLFPMALTVHGEAPATQVQFTILHTNDFHGQLEASGSNPGMARVAAVVNGVRTAVGAANVLLVDAGDEMQGSLLSNMQKGAPTIAVFKAMGYNAATFGNHEFDWGQDVLIARTGEAAPVYPFLSANIVAGDCTSWTPPSFATPYSIVSVGSPTKVKVGFIGVTTQETPYITIAAATAGLCFRDPAESILHYYDAMKAAGADVIVVLSHLGYTDGGYGYGFPVYGDQTLAQKLNTAGKPVNLIVGGHTHTNLSAVTMVGSTAVVQAYYNGRKVGRAYITVGTNGSVTLNSWQSLTVSTTGAKDPAIDALITTYASDSGYQTLINLPVGYSAVDLPRLGGTVDNMMGTFVDDAIYHWLNTDSTPANDVDLFFNNAGGIRTDWCWNGTAWVNTGCVAALHAPALLTYGNMFTILPFGNATVVGTMTGAEILQVLNQAPQVSNGAIQPAGLKYKYYAYKDANPGPQPFAWGAFDYCVMNGSTCEPLDMARTYRVGTNEFLAPAGGDGYFGFKYMKNITYWGDMLNAVNAYVADHNGTTATAYKGPNGDGTLDGRIIRDGTDTPGSGSIVPITILHHNDSHGNLVKGAFVGYTQLAAKITQERAHNPTRTLLLNAGDSFQGDSMMYYFKSAALGYAADGTPLAPALQINPLMAAFNAMNYDAMTLGNHEFNFGSQIFTSLLGKANFPILQANLVDDGRYGIAQVPVEPYVEKVVGAEGIKVAILGIGNHRIPNYELPSNIPGLTFTNPITVAQELSNALRPTNDVVIALTHIGFTENPASVEVDTNVDTNMAATVTGLDTIIGGHSHTDPSKQTAYSGAYKFLPTIVAGPNNKPVLITQAYRYNNTLGEVVLGMRSDGHGGWQVASQAGRYISIVLADPEDAAIQAIAQPFVDVLATYNNTVLGQTTAPIDALQAFTQETNGANLQADASVWELETHHSIPVDFHLSGAMTNQKVADAATPASPVTLKVSDMFKLMPYENSLVVMRMNGPQLKAVLERAYRNYYYYKYVAGYGGYSYYTTCMIDTNAGGKITYNDPGGSVPYDPNRQYVVSLVYDGHQVNFSDATTYYRVSTVNYLAAGSCNFNNSGVSLWPLDQIVNDTQYYVRDAVINYITAMGTVSPAIEGRLRFLSPAEPVGLSNVSLVRNYNGEGNMGNMVADGMRWKADMYDDGVLNDSVDIAFTNAGGLKADILAPADGTLPYTITWGDTSKVLPSPNTLFVMDLTGAQIQALLNQAATLYKGILQSSGITWRWYNDCGCATPTESSAFDVRVGGKLLDPNAVYRVVTNNFLAAGGDGFVTFNEGTYRWDTGYDMQFGVNEYIQWYNQTAGPIDHQVEGRILYTIAKAEDTEIHRYDADTPFATYPRIEVGTWKSEPRSGIVRFPVNLPANVTIDSASLQLYEAGWSGIGANITVGAYAILRPVTVAEATWNVAQADNPWAIPGCGDAVLDRRPTAEFTLTTGIPRYWYAFDVTALVQDWIKGTTANNGVLLRSEIEAQGASVFFASNEYSDESVHPRLVIQWH